MERVGSGRSGVGRLQHLRRRLALRVATSICGTVTGLGLAVTGLGPAAVSGAAPALPGSIRDITGTAVGRALAERSAARFARSGGMATFVAPADLVVLQDSTGMTVGPRAAIYMSRASRGVNGVQQVEALPVTMARSATSAVAVQRFVPMAIAASWTFVGNQCFSRISDTFSWLDHCYTMYRLANDGDPTRDWYALNHFATMQANAPWVMNAASIGTAPVAATPQAWADWSPRTAMAGPCRQIVVSITTPVGGLPDSTRQCETWTIAKSATAGDFAVKWDGRGQRAARELSLEIAVSVPQNGWPQWSLPAWVSGSPF